MTEPETEQEGERTWDLPCLEPVTEPKGRRRGQKDLPCLGPVTEPKAEEEDRRTKNLPCLGPVTEPDRTHLAGTSDRARGKKKSKEKIKDLPCLGPVIEPEAEEDRRTYLAWGQ